MNRVKILIFHSFCPSVFFPRSVHSKIWREQSNPHNINRLLVWSCTFIKYMSDVVWFQRRRKRQVIFKKVLLIQLLSLQLYLKIWLKCPNFLRKPWNDMLIFNFVETWKYTLWTNWNARCWLSKARYLLKITEIWKHLSET